MTTPHVHIRINDVDLKVTTTGSGIPLIWGHGLMSSLDAEDLAGVLQWERVGDAAAVTRYDARGHGQSGASTDPDDYTWPNLAKDMLALADQLGLERFVAGGMSMGCATAIYAALAAPERVRALILATPPTAWETRAAQGAMYEQMAALIEAQGTPALAAMLAQQPQAIFPPLLLAAAPQLAERMGAQLAAYDAATLANVLRGAKQTDLPPRQQLRSIAVPALVLAWEGDRGHPLATAEELATLLPSAQLHIARTPDELRAWPELIREFVDALGQADA